MASGMSHETSTSASAMGLTSGESDLPTLHVKGHAKTHASISLDVSDVTYEVTPETVGILSRLMAFQMPWEWTKNTGTKRILDKVNVHVKSGEMLAILGSSGSGKTSLLDVISQRVTQGTIRGAVTLDGEKCSQQVFQRHGAYVRQEDRLMPHLTVRETLTFVAKLKLPRGTSRREREHRVSSVAQELGLSHVMDTRVGGPQVRGISGGERRRVTIATQLLLDPSLLLLDEPTSGLDSFTAHHLVETLSNLAANNRVVIITIHQPRSDIFTLFDKMMILTLGHVVYNGAAGEMLEYFASIGQPCPRYCNPCDFYVDLSTVDTKTPEKEEVTGATVRELIDKFQEHSASSTAHQDNVNQVSPSPSSSEASGVSSGSKISHAGFWTQFAVLSRRSLQNTVEDYPQIGVQFAESLGMSLIAGFVFFNLNTDQLSVRDRFGLLYIFAALYPYLCALDSVGKYFQERRVIYFEMQDGLYTPWALFFSKVLSELPEHTILSIIYAVPVYFLSSLQPGYEHFLPFAAITWLMIYSSKCLGLASAALMPRRALGYIFMQFLYTIFTTSSGFIINIDSIPEATRWCNKISFIKWSFQGMCLVEFDGLNFTCPPEYPPNSCIHTGDQALDLYTLNDSSVLTCGLLTAAITGVFLLAFLFAALFIKQKPDEQI